MSAKKIVVIVLSSALALILGFCTFWVINNYDAIEYAMSGSALYTKADLEKAYEDGYNSAGFDVKDLNDQIADLRNKLDTKTAEYNKVKADYEKYLKKYNELVVSSEQEKAELNAIIHGLNSEITELEKDIANLETTLETFKEFQAQLEAENKVIATFEYDGAVISMQSYEKGAKLQDVIVPDNTDEITFNGWTVNGQAVDISDYTINESTTFVADLTYHYLEKYNALELINYNDVIDTGACLWTDGVDIYYSRGIQYVLNKETSTWVEKTWGGLYPSHGYYVWTDGENVYCSDDEKQYILDKATSTWEAKTWIGNNNLYGHCVWTDGENYYFTHHNQTYKFVRK